MKGIILAGGSGTRLYPVTKAISKQILPIYDKPMIYYPLSVLMLSGIQDILIISTDRDINLYKELFDTGNKLGLNIQYEIQIEPRGIADAFIVGKKFIGNDRVALVLGDNIFYGQNFSQILKTASEREVGATIFGYYVSEPNEYGVVEFDNNFNVISIEEKPKNPKSHYAVPGLYFYDNNVVEIAKSIKPSGRGELEITEVNNIYLKNKKLKAQLMGRGMTWLDTGNYDNLLEASNFVATLQKRQGLCISCIEEIAFNKGFIDREQLLKLAKPLEKVPYGKYLVKIAKGLI